MAMLLELSLETLKDLDDGKVAVIFNQALKRVVDDCNDRPGDKTKRQVHLLLEVKPITDAAGHLETVAIKPRTRTKLPESHVRELQLSPRKLQGKGNVLAFNPGSPDVRQGNLEFEED